MHRPRPASTGRAALLAAALLLPVTGARAAAVAGKEEAAIRAVFPAAEAVEAKDVILTDEMVGRIERLARARVRERLVTFYTARRGAEVVGYAVIHSHVVRTKRETLSIAFEPDGRLRKITVLAFLEPSEYRPSERWLAQLEGKGPADRLAVGQDLAPISGATLTARGVAEESRWLLQALREAMGVGR
ncbi:MULTISPECIES: FMN-binding protein [Anaeromyxobacter]|uniref:FMN-binding protein n=1 Tax=Anaeromyxobacter TaxID=161492 RepID=UPI001F56D4E7|nr:MULTISPECIES: FMN-binding protein [unclassified Anaeromyxobacter]